MKKLAPNPSRHVAFELCMADGAAVLVVWRRTVARRP